MLICSADGIDAVIMPVQPMQAPTPVEIDRPDKGVFLVASEDMVDSWFRQSVVFLVTHGEEGTLGLIINRPTRVAMSEVLPELRGTGVNQHRLFWGGPVAMERALFLTRSRIRLGQAEHIIDDIYASADRDMLQEMLDSDKANDQLRLYVGHAGWAPGQLDAEIAEGAWYLFKANAATVFHDKPETIWREFIGSRSRGRIMVWRRH